MRGPRSYGGIFFMDKESPLKMNYGDLTQVTYWLHTLFHVHLQALPGY